ncbi:hypothetical protein D3C80_1672320 [compost metagenome]
MSDQWLLYKCFVTGELFTSNKNKQESPVAGPSGAISGFVLSSLGVCHALDDFVNVVYRRLRQRLDRRLGQTHLLDEPSTAFAKQQVLASQQFFTQGKFSIQVIA